MTKDLPEAGMVGAGLTSRARKGSLLGLFVSIPLVLLGALAGLAGAATAYPASATGTRMMLITVGILVVVGVLGFLLYLKVRARRFAERTSLLQSIVDGGVGWLVTHLIVSTSADVSQEWTMKKGPKAHAIVVQPGLLRLVSLDRGVSILASFSFESIEAKIGARSLYRTELTTIDVTSSNRDVSLKLSGLPVEVRRFAHPSFENLGALVAAVNAIGDATKLTSSEER